MFSNLFPKNPSVYETMRRNIVEPDIPQLTWRMRISCWIPKPTLTHSPYTIHIIFSLQVLLHSPSSLLRYARIACLVYSKFLRNMFRHFKEPNGGRFLSRNLLHCDLRLLSYRMSHVATEGYFMNSRRAPVYIRTCAMWLTVSSEWILNGVEISNGHVRCCCWFCAVSYISVSVRSESKLNAGRRVVLWL
jgi:hypothetical protein